MNSIEYWLDTLDEVVEGLQDKFLGVQNPDKSWTWSLRTSYCFELDFVDRNTFRPYNSVLIFFKTEMMCATVQERELKPEEMLSTTKDVWTAHKHRDNTLYLSYQSIILWISLKMNDRNRNATKISDRIYRSLEMIPLARDAGISADRRMNHHP